MKELPLTLTDAARALRASTVTSAELTEAAIAAADALDHRVGTFIDRYRDGARAAAAAADRELAAGRDRGPLHGIPFAVKDIISTADGPTTAQSVVLDPAWGEGIGDAVVVRRLREAGAVIVGKTTTMEFALGMTDPDKPFPTPRNPWNLDCWAGGSSSGTGSAVAAGMALAGLGTDTGGSIRIPAAFCGITGLKPTFGRVPKSGVVPFSQTIDAVGPMARSAADCAAVLEVVAGYDASDPNCADAPVQPWTDALTGDLTGVRVGVAPLPPPADVEQPDAEQQAAFTAAADVLRAAGAEVVRVELPMYQELQAAIVVMQFSEAVAYHSADLRSRWHDYSRDTRMRLAAGLGISGADYVQAQRVRRVGQRAVARMFTDVDVVITPTLFQGAPRLDGHVIAAAGLTRFAHTLHTTYWNAVGNPVLATPIGFDSDGLPLSMQVAARPFDEALALRVGDAYQRLTDHHLAVPPLARAALTA